MFEPGTIWYVPDNVSPDGRWLAGFIWDVETDTHWDVEIVSLEGEITRERFSPGPHNEWFPRFSPDGGWLAYTSDRSGQNEVYIKRFPERGAPIQVSRGGGRRPLWSRSGDELYYLAWDKKPALMRVEIELGASPRVGEAQPIDLPSDLMPHDWSPWGSVARHPPPSPAPANDPG